MTPLAEIIGDSPGIRRLREQLEHILTRAAMTPRPPPILLCGETGTGKSLVARTLHRAGPRAVAPFVDVNCAAIPDTLLDSPSLQSMVCQPTGPNGERTECVHREASGLDEVRATAATI